jgi:SAM-dependent methyltransferase
LVVGSIVLGVLLGALLATVTYLSLRASNTDPAFLDLVRAASDRYLAASITAWEFARGKLRGDPLYRSILCGGLLPSGRTLLDLGCGSGLMLSLLAEARSRVHSGRWDRGLPAPPLFERMIGVDIRPRVVRVARQALNGDAEILQVDARKVDPSTHDAILLCDVLHMIHLDEQEQVIALARRSLEEGGVLLVREADAAGGWRFAVVRAGNRLKAIFLGHWRQRFYFRTHVEWCGLFARHGLAVLSVPNGGGTPFASVLFRLTVIPDGSATHRTRTRAD